MNDFEIDRLLGLSQPAPVPPAALAEAGQDLLEEIMSTASRPELSGKPEDPVHLLPQSRKTSTGSRILVGAAVALAVAAAILTPTVVFGGGGHSVVPASTPSSSTSPAPTETSPVPKTTNPFVLLDAPGWNIGSVSENDWGKGVYGEIRYTAGEAGMEMRWEPAAGYQDKVDDRTAEYGKPKFIRFLGAKAMLFEDSNGEFEVMAKRGDAFLAVQVTGESDLKSQRQQLARLTPVTPDQWYAAMPDSVVTPAESTGIAAQIIEDIPLPKGFDTTIFTSDLTNSYHQFGAGVTGRITCAWLDAYTDAYDAGDAKGMGAVGKALSDAADWAFIKRSGESSGWAQAITDYTERVAERKPVSGYLSGLGCDMFPNS